jgi:hypothetical protein
VGVCGSLTGDDVEARATAVFGESGGPNDPRPAGQDVHPGSDHVRLQHLRHHDVGTEGAERRHDGRRPDAENRAAEAEHRHRPAPAAARGVLPYLVADRPPDGHGGEEVAVGHELLPVGRRVGQDHPRAAGRLDDGFSTRAVTPRSQSTIFPRTVAGSSVPERQSLLALSRPLP